MLHHLFFGILLGWGVAVPLGPMNMEIIRRNLQFGTRYGLALGFGVCSADVTFLLLMSLGALVILNHPLALQIVGVIGSIILAWFGYSALRMTPQTTFITATKFNPTYSLLRHSAEGYALTFFNPYSILFWSSVSSQIAIASQSSNYAALPIALGVLLGTCSWAFGLNWFLHLTRHKISEKMMRRLNIAGGLVLMGFAVLGFLRVFAQII